MKNLLISASNITQLDAFSESSFLEKASKKFNISFLIFKLDREDKNRIKMLEKYGTIQESYVSQKKGIINKTLFLLRKKLNLICYFANEINQNKNRFNKDYVVNKTLNVNGPNYILFFKFLDYFKLLKLIQLILITFLRLTPYNHLKKIENIDLIILAYKVYDPSSFSDDLIRVAKKKILNYLEYKLIGML